jgi:hypothetical protein
MYQSINCSKMWRNIRFAGTWFSISTYIEIGLLPISVTCKSIEIGRLEHILHRSRNCYRKPLKKASTPHSSTRTFPRWKIWGISSGFLINFCSILFLCMVVVRTFSPTSPFWAHLLAATSSLHFSKNQQPRSCQ